MRNRYWQEISIRVVRDANLPYSLSVPTDYLSYFSHTFVMDPRIQASNSKGITANALRWFKVPHRCFRDFNNSVYIKIHHSFAAARQKTALFIMGFMRGCYYNALRTGTNMDSIHAWSFMKHVFLSHGCLKYIHCVMNIFCVINTVQLNTN